jgi:hypothetical protein
VYLRRLNFFGFCCFEANSKQNNAQIYLDSSAFTKLGQAVKALLSFL